MMVRFKKTNLRGRRGTQQKRSEIYVLPQLEAHDARSRVSTQETLRPESTHSDWTNWVGVRGDLFIR